MRCGCALVVLAIALIFFGIAEIRDAHSFSKPVDIAVEQFLKSPPQEGWYRIKGCEFSILDSVYIVTTYHSKYGSDSTKSDEQDSGSTGTASGSTNQETGATSDGSASEPSAKKKPGSGEKSPAGGKNGGDAAHKPGTSDTEDAGGAAKHGSDSGASSPSTPDDGKDIHEVYIPVHTESLWNEKTETYAPTHLVLKTSDPEIISLVNEVKHMDDPKGDQITKWLTTNKDKLVIHKDLVGMVETGIHLDEKERDLIAKDQESVAPGYVIVDEGRTPSMAGGLGALFGGVLVGIVSVLYWAAFLFRGKRQVI